MATAAASRHSWTNLDYESPVNMDFDLDLHATMTNTSSYSQPVNESVWTSPDRGNILDISDRKVSATTPLQHLEQCMTQVSNVSNYNRIPQSMLGHNSPNTSAHAPVSPLSGSNDSSTGDFLVRNHLCDEFSHHHQIAQSRKRYKQATPPDQKDDKYWQRRQKNNIAAKRSRDAKRNKEQETMQKAANLEKANTELKRQVNELQQKNKELTRRLSKYENDKTFLS
ncbi:DgyrCDS2327 [Dimorphilus gyrociliatus]|uniref:DgyrCDS2327 n=1 Tax=Dimorphilus gyrociliatus TaxID=2664684 RepID=A0A7I8VBR8_9ANNE|nr:DgyrCDS2327 [Dimorphilus gyrociliatus]